MGLFVKGGLELLENYHDSTGVGVWRVHMVFGTELEPGVPKTAANFFYVGDSLFGAFCELHLRPAEQLDGPFVLETIELKIEEERAFVIQNAVDGLDDRLSKGREREVGRHAADHHEADIFHGGLSEPRQNVLALILDTCDGLIVIAVFCEKLLGMDGGVFVDRQNLLDIAVEIEAVVAAPGHPASAEICDLAVEPGFAVVFNRRNQVCHKELALALVDEGRDIVDKIRNVVGIRDAAVPVAVGIVTSAVGHLEGGRGRSRDRDQPREEKVRLGTATVQNESGESQIFLHHRLDELPDAVHLGLQRVPVGVVVGVVDLLYYFRIGDNVSFHLLITKSDVFGELFGLHHAGLLDRVKKIVMANHVLKPPPFC